jgi:Flp pilus assembly protein CpaB
VVTSFRKRLMLATTLVVCVVAVGLVAHRVGSIDSVPPHVVAQAAAEPPPRAAVAAASASALSFGSRVAAAVKAAESMPRAGIGTAAFATKP